MRDTSDRNSLFKKKEPDILRAHIKAVNERIPNITDKNFEEQLEHMTKLLLGENETLAAPPKRDGVVVKNIRDEIMGTGVDMLAKVIWQSNTVEWAEDPNYFTALGIAFAEETKNQKLSERLSRGLRS